MAVRFTSTSKIFDKSARSQAIANVISRGARDFKRTTQQRMIKGPHSGRLYDRRRGAGFTRKHRASARGQRPSPDSMTLVNAIAVRKKSDLLHEVYIAEKVNPASGTVASKYGDILQNKFGRSIMTEKDAAEAEVKLVRDAELVIKTLV